MSELSNALTIRFNSSKIRTIPKTNGDDFSLIAIELNLRSPLTLIMTDGLRAYEQPVDETKNGQKFIELFFCLPSYWDLDEPTDQWVIEWLQKLSKHLVRKKTWYGEGHTFPNGNPIHQISEKMQQKYFLLSEPIYITDLKNALEVEGKNVNFLSIIPIFEDEFDYKIGKGNYKLMKKMKDKGINEVLDHFRMTCLKNKWRLFK